jgi:rod shape-determining protein MreD
MSESRSHLILIPLSVMLALLLAIYPLPLAWSHYRPEMVCLVTIYWVLHRPEQLGVGFAWLVGFIQDVVEDGVWGGHAVALAFVAYVCLMAYRRLRIYSLAQQALWIFVFVGVHQVLVNWLQSLDGYGGQVRYLTISALATALVWPFLVMVLDFAQRRYRLL